jgi:DNA-binding MltR family transcriptional regulator
MAAKRKNKFPHLARISAFRDSLNSETDRGCAIFAAAFLDEELKVFLTKTFVDEPKLVNEFIGRNGPLSNFSARIDFAFLTGWLAVAEWRDLHLIRKIRNDFAHYPNTVSFTDENIRNRCKEFCHSGREKQATARQHFTSVVCGVLGCIHARLSDAKHPKIPANIFATEQEKETFRVEVKNIADKICGEFEGNSD